MSDVAKRVVEDQEMHEGSLVMTTNKFGVSSTITPASTFDVRRGYFGREPTGVLDSIASGLIDRFDNREYY